MTTYDCTAGGHFGYAYFTLGCTDGKIKGFTAPCLYTQQHRYQDPNNGTYFYSPYISSKTFDGGSTWQDSNEKIYSSNTSISMLTKDVSGNNSDVITGSINNIDKLMVK